MRLTSLFHIALGTALLASCVTEDLDIRPGENRKTSLTLTLSMGEMKTKAPGDEVPAAYEWATLNELTVSNCIVAVFSLNESGEPGKQIGYLEASGDKLTSAIVDGSPVYTLTNVPTLTGKVRLLVIANSDQDFSNCSHYSDYRAKVESTQFTSTFDPRRLVKVGYIDRDITVNNYTDALVVPMTQLAARVDLKLIVKLDKMIEGQTAIYPAKVEENIFAAIGKQGGSGSWFIDGVSYTGMECLNHFNHQQYIYNRPFYNPFTHQWERSGTGGSGQKFAEIDNLTIDSVTTIGSWGLKLNSITVNNIQTKTPVLIESKNELALQQPNGGPWQQAFTPDSTVVDTFRVTFYTYQKEMYASDEDPEALNISLDVKLTKGVYTMTTRYLVRSFGIWVRENGTTQGWSSGNEAGRFVPLSNIGEALGPPQPGSFIDQAEPQEYPRKFTLWINPRKGKPGCHTDGLIHGNLYATEVTFQSVIVDPTVEYTVVDWAMHTKNIPDFQ